MRTILVILSCIISMSLSAKAYDPAADIFKERPSKKERIYSRHLSKAINQLYRNRLHKKSIRALVRLSKKDKTFKVYHPFIHTLNKVSRIKTYKKFGSCDRVLRKGYSGVSKNLYRPLKKYCRNLYLKLLEKSNHRLTKSDKKYFRKNIDTYLFPLNRRFVKFLEHSKEDTLFHSYISRIISERYMETGKVVPFKILKNIHITSKFTRFIQENGLFDTKTQKVFHRELKYLSNQLRPKKYKEEYTPKIVQNKLKTIQNFYYLNQNYIDDYFAKRRFIILGKRLLHAEYYDSAKDAFEVALNISQEDKDDVRFHYLWVDLIRNNYKQANVVIEKFNLHEEFDDLDARLQFWVAITMEEIGNEKLAKYYYEKIVNETPIGYYSIMSLKQLKKIEASRFTRSFISGVTNPIHDLNNLSSAHYSSFMRDSLKRLYLFSKISNNRLISLETKRINTAPIDKIFSNPQMFSNTPSVTIKERLTLLIAKTISQGNNYLRSFSVIYRGLRNNTLNANSNVLKTLFPTPFLDEIERMTSEDIDPFIVLALIRQESAFNPRARSIVGARGLMQLMPATAKSVSRRVSKRQLSNPKTNLKIGIKFFKHLFRRFDGNLVYTLAAYNAGEHRVKDWKNRVFRNDGFLHLVESVPYRETNLYVKLIFRNIFFYKLMSGHRIDTAENNTIFDIQLAQNE